MTLFGMEFIMCLFKVRYYRKKYFIVLRLKTKVLLDYLKKFNRFFKLAIIFIAYE